MLPIELCNLSDNENITVYINGKKYISSELSYIKNGTLYLLYEELCSLLGITCLKKCSLYVPARFLLQNHNLTLSWEADTSSLYISNDLHYDGYRKIPEDLMIGKSNNHYIDGYYFVDAVVLESDDRTVTIRRYIDDKPIKLLKISDYNFQSTKRMRFCFKLLDYNLQPDQQGILFEAVDIDSFEQVGYMQYSVQDSRVIRELLPQKEIIQHSCHTSNANKFGDAESFFMLGRDYQYGEGGDVDYKKAFKYYLKAVEQEHCGATLNLGFMYVMGYGVKQNYQKGIELYELAVDDGDTTAMTNLGKLYRDGDGVEQKLELAKYYFLKAAEMGDSTAEYLMSNLYNKGFLIDDLSKSKEREWLEKSAEHGSDLAQMLLGEAYKDGRFGVQSYEKAVDYFIKATGKHCNSMVAVASFVQLGIVFYYYLDDVVEAEMWMKKAALNGRVEAQYLLGVFYSDDDILFNIEEAKNWLGKAVSQGYKKAMKKLEELESDSNE